MHARLNCFLRSILAGFLIGIGGLLFLVSGDTLIGSILFSVGLLSILLCKLNLFTGKTACIVTNEICWFDLFMIYVGNYIGTTLAAFIATYSGRFEKEILRAYGLVHPKFDQGFLTTMTISIICGFLVFIAVDAYRRYCTDSLVVIILCVSSFILCRSEHCIADMFYINLGHAWCYEALKFLVAVTIGNFLGSIIVPSLRKLGGLK